MSKGTLAFLCDQQKGECAQGLWSSHREATDPQSRGCFLWKQILDPALHSKPWPMVQAQSKTLTAWSLRLATENVLCGWLMAWLRHEGVMDWWKLGLVKVIKARL